MKKRQARASQLLAFFFSLLWVGWILLDYFQKRTLYAISLETNAFYTPIVLVSGLSLMCYYLIKSNILKPSWINGSSVIIAGTAIFCLMLSISKSSFEADYPQFDLSILGFLKWFWLYMLALLFILVSTYGLGIYLLKKTKMPLKKPYLRIAALPAGLFAMSFYMLLLGAIHQLYWYTLLPVFLGAIALAYKDILELLQLFFIKSILPKKDFEWFGYLSFGLLFMVCYIGLAQSVTIYPKGYDALNLYANLPKLIAQNNGLLEGNRPYAWSLFQSTGFFLFNSKEVAHLLSGIGGILVALISAFIARRQFGFRPDQTILAICLFVTIPAFTIQLSHELKIDLALLYIELTVLSLTVRYLRKNESLKLLIFIGLLLGFGLSIKLTALLLIFSTIVVLWYRPEKTGLPMAMFCFLLSMILFFRIDRFSGLDHLIGGRYVTASLLILVGIALAINHALADRHYILNRMKSTTILGAIILLGFAPWMIKNAVDCGFQGIECIVNGAPEKMKLNLKEMDREYRNQINREN